MPKLNDQMASNIDESAGGGGDFKPLDPGIYTVRLREVEVKEGKVAPYWRWTYEIPEGEPNARRRFWDNTSLSEKSLWRFKKTFEAFGVPTNTDTDDLLGRRVRVRIGLEPIGAGDRQGEMTNTVKELLPALTDDTVSAFDDSPF